MQGAVGRKINRHKEERAKTMSDHLRPLMSSMGTASDADSLSLSIADASVFGSTGPILKVPALRVSVRAIQARWSAGFEAMRTRDPAVEVSRSESVFNPGESRVNLINFGESAQSCSSGHDDHIAAQFFKVRRTPPAG